MPKKTKKKQTKKQTKKNIAHKGVIVGLSIALALAATSAVAVPLVLVNQNKGDAESNTYTVHFETDGGTTLPDQKIVKGQSLNEPLVTKEGWTVEGWYTNSEKTGEKVAFPYTVNSDITLYVKWSSSPVAIYTVTYETFGGSTISPQEVLAGKTISEPSVTKEGYIVEKWYSNSGFTEEVNFPYTVTGNVTLYVKWTVAPEPTTLYTVKYETGGGSTISSQEVLAGKTINEPSTIWQGHLVEGWYTDSAKTKRVTWPYKVTNSVTLYVNWIEGTTPTTIYNVSYNTDGGTTLGDQKVYENGEIHEPTVSKTGYIVEGWYTDSAKTGQKITFPYTVTDNVTLYVKWSTAPVTYFTVKFESNGGTTLSDQKVSTSGGSINEPVVAKPGSTLEGWYTEATFINKISFPYSVTSDVTLYAKWSTEPVVEYKTVTFNGNGKITFASGSETAQAQILKGAQIGTIVYPQIVTTAEGYAFDGWCYDAAGQQPVKSTDTISTDKIIYAHCIEKNTKVTISFSAGTGASLIGQSSIEVDKGTTWAEIKNNLPSAKKDGYTFSCWLLDGYVIDDNQTFDDNSMLTAAFTEDEICKVEIVLVGSQELVEGTLEIEVEYGTKWKEFAKPTLKDGDKTFSGWYKESTFDNQWQDDDKITNTWDNTKVYAKFETPTTCPTITFADPDSSGDYTWVGTRTIKSETSFILWNNVAKPGVYKSATGTWSTGYESDYYFSSWSLSPTEYVAVPSKITVSTTIYPMFEEKPELTLKYLDKTYSTITETFKAEPDATWSTIPLPIAYTAEENQYFIGWQANMKDGTENKQLEPNDLIKNIDTTEPITPIFNDQVNLLEFQTTGIEYLGESETETEVTDIVYEGNPTVGVNKTKTTYLKDVNKPIATKDNYAFLRWQIWDDSLETPAWVEITDDTAIAASETQTTTLIRPVVEQTFTITFDANGGTIVEPVEHERESIVTNSRTAFGDLYKPDVTPATNKVFQYWAIKNEDGTYTKIEDSYCFDGATTIYAVYDDDIISSIVNFKLTTADKNDTDYPCTISGTKACINHKPGEEYKFKDISKATATKSLHYLEGWYYDEACLNPVDEEDVLPEGNEELTVYAKFAWTTTYEKVTVAEPTGTEYEILTDNKMFVKTGSYWKNISNTFEIKVKKVGYDVDYWKDQNGVNVTDNYQFNTTTTLTPVFKECKKQVTIDLEGDTTISGVTNGQVVEVGYYDTLKDKLTSLSPSKEKNTFIGWKIKNADNTYTDVDDNTVVTSDLTIVPKFRGESEFKNGTQPYFYDSVEGKWAAIVDCSGTDMTIRYAGATSTSTLDKYTFNEEVFFGSQMTEIPDYFMYGCTNWNNGYKSGGSAKPLTIPSTMHDVNGVMKIGNFVFAGCSEFTQQLIIEAPTGFDYPELEVGESFMDQCYKWNNDLDLSGFNNITVGEAFMHDCKSWIGTLTLTGWLGVDGDASLCFASSDKYCNFVQLGFKVKTTGMSYDDFKGIFSISTSAPYRTHTEAE